MNITGITIAACVWRSGDFDPLVRKDKKGRWTFLSEEFNGQTDGNILRHTLERALFQRMKGTLNPLNFCQPGFAFNLALASPKACVVFTSESGEQCLHRPPALKPVRLQVVVPVFEVSGNASYGQGPGFGSVARVYHAHGRLLAVVQETLQRRTDDWSPLTRSKDNRPVRINSGDLASQLRRAGVPEDLSKRLAWPSSEDYWQPSPKDLKSVA